MLLNSYRNSISYRLIHCRVICEPRLFCSPRTFTWTTAPLQLALELRAHHDLGTVATLAHGFTAVFLQLALVICAQEPPQDVAPRDQVIKLLRSQVALADQALQTLGLLLSILLVGASLLEDLDVVLSVLVLQSRREGCGLLNTIAISVLELLNDSVKGLDGATSGIQTTADGAMSAGVLVEELNESILRTGTLIGAGLD